ncbi:hypothetical protein SCG7086_AJ_00260 [Chlamydiales bacterium SCGC AG-110-P3]|nr:hypothetical protein SCG7086_AJ_00260 [Chlamydiales bacterium SCGC AG-110-P3]
MKEGLGGMMAIELGDEEVQEVLRERFAHPCPKVQKEWRCYIYVI